MNKNSIVILPVGVEVPEEIKSTAEIVGLFQDDGSLDIALNKHDGPSHFENVSEFFAYVGTVKSDV
jgi:hypothetical protein